MPRTITLQLSPKQASDPKVYVPVAARMAGVSEGQVALARIVKRSVDARRSVHGGTAGTGGTKNADSTKNAGGAPPPTSVRSPKVNLTLELYIDDEQQPAPVHFDYPDVTGRTPVVIVGSGPAGLFTALRLIESGLRPILLERGKDVAERGKDIARINRGDGVDPDSNYAFGEGGAGTFSDGKLFTRSKKRGDYNRALQTLVFHGASPEILYEAHPHIGTDKLPRIMTAIRRTIIGCGGEVVFGARVTDIEIRDGRAAGVWIDRSAPKSGDMEPRPNSPAISFVQPTGTLIEGAAVVLAAGHSARDIYEILHRRGIALEAKPFAMGVRIEHPQQLIDNIQYHTPDGRGEYLPPASYSLVSQEGRYSAGKSSTARSTTVRSSAARGLAAERGSAVRGATVRGSAAGSGRGVYSFCMCPGGFIVPAMTDAAESVVNGMSPSLRNSPYANSGIVTEVRLSDFEFLRPEFGDLAGLEFRRRLEHLARAQANGHDAHGVTAPAQRVSDFVSARPSHSLPKTSYVPGIVPSRLDEWLPRFMSNALRAGISTFGRQMKGFVTNEAVIVGVESRTSTPVRIPRDPETLAHPAVANLYPAGEGAGYAGGIISAALDGERIAEAINIAVK